MFPQMVVNIKLLILNTKFLVVRDVGLEPPFGPRTVISDPQPR